MYLNSNFGTKSNVYKYAKVEIKFQSSRISITMMLKSSIIFILLAVAVNCMHNIMHKDGFVTVGSYKSKYIIIFNY